MKDRWRRLTLIAESVIPGPRPSHPLDSLDGPSRYAYDVLTDHRHDGGCILDVPGGRLCRNGLSEKRQRLRDEGATDEQVHASIMLWQPTIPELRVLEDMWEATAAPAQVRRRRVADWERRYRATVRAIRAEGGSLDWEDVAARMSSELRLEGEDALPGETLRRWAREDEVPSPRKLNDS